jgi:acyl carrier protein
MASTADEIVGMIKSRSSFTGGEIKLSDPLDKLGLDSFEVVSLTFDIEEKFDIELPFNANSDIDSKTVADLVHTVERLVAAKAAPA